MTMEVLHLYLFIFFFYAADSIEGENEGKTDEKKAGLLSLHPRAAAAQSPAVLPAQLHFINSRVVVKADRRIHY